MFSSRSGRGILMTSVLPSWNRTSNTTSMALKAAFRSRALIWRLSPISRCTQHRTDAHLLTERREISIYITYILPTIPSHIRYLLWERGLDILQLSPVKLIVWRPGWYQLQLYPTHVYPRLIQIVEMHPGFFQLSLFRTTLYYQTTPVPTQRSSSWSATVCCGIYTEFLVIPVLQLTLSHG